MDSENNSCLISTQEFNDLPHLHDQVQFPNDPATIAALGDVFYKHNVHERFALHLLHRHYALPENCIVLKADIDSEISLAKIELLSNVDVNGLRGVLYHLDDTGRFQEYEYEQGDQIDIPKDFLEELSGVLRQFKLEKVLALDVVGGDSPSITRFEYDLGNTATVTVQLNRNPTEPGDRQTGMAFSLEAGEPHVYGPNVYAANIKGKHTVFYNHNKAVVDEANFNIDTSAIRGVLISNGILAH